MKCRDFHRHLADWVRGRLPAETDDLLTRHMSECRCCREEAELERSLRASFATIAPVTRTPDLWERIEARVQTAKQPRFAFAFQRAFALGGALAAGVLLSFIALPHPSMVSPSAGEGMARNEPGVLEKVRTIRMTELDPVGTYTETPYSGDAAHMLLVGTQSR